MALSGIYTFVGAGDWSLDATSGSATGGGTLQVSVPVGSVVLQAISMNRPSAAALGQWT